MMLLFAAQNLSMTGVTYVALYDTSTGEVIALFYYASTENISTAFGDGHLTLDGVKVASFDDTLTANLGLLEMANPSYDDITAPVGVYEVDSVSSPTDITERTDGGRDSKYSFTT
jgi:hypothetical protein